MKLPYADLPAKLALISVIFWPLLLRPTPAGSLVSCDRKRARCRPGFAQTLYDFLRTARLRLMIEIARSGFVMKWVFPQG